jgi:DNA-binding XRE family transcriptional regulator
MIRAARSLLGYDQEKLAGLVAIERKDNERKPINRRTIIRIETDEVGRDNPRRVEVIAAIRDALEKEGIRFIYADRNTGEGVVMKKGK